MVRLLSSVHLLELEKWEKCGCPECLQADHLKLVDIYDPDQRRVRGFLVPLHPTIPGLILPSPCSDNPDSRNGSKNSKRA